jgi:prepilin-type N-terminal cleavage/methylation domain-containing protein
MKLSKNNTHIAKGFTLIELLVVIAIISTLGGLSYGPIMRQLQSADVLKATKVCKDLTFSINGYEQTYGSLPYVGADYPAVDENIKTEDSEGINFLNIIMGDNDRGKKFFTSDEAKGTKDGLVFESGNVVKLVDKWNNPYTIRLDYDGDGVIDASLIADGAPYEKELHIESAIAASPTADGLFNDERDAKSW